MPALFLIFGESSQPLTIKFDISCSFFFFKLVLFRDEEFLLFLSMLRGFLKSRIGVTLYQIIF